MVYLHYISAIHPDGNRHFLALLAHVEHTSVLTPVSTSSIKTLGPPGDVPPAAWRVCYPGWEAVSVCQGSCNETGRWGRHAHTHTHTITITDLSWGWLVCWLLNVPATCECFSGTDQLRQFEVLPHWDRRCRSNFPSHPVTVYWHRADQSQRWPYNAKRLAG